MSALSFRSVVAAHLLGLLTLPALAADVVRLASDEWCPYVCTANGRIQGGYVVEVTSRAMAVTGWRVEPFLMPLNRAMRQTVQGDLDGVFAPPEDARLLPSTVLGYSRACLYVRAGSNWRYRGLRSLSGLRLGAIGDYEYDNGPMDDHISTLRGNRDAIDFSYGANAGLTNLRKLLGGRFDVLVEHEAVLHHLARQAGVEGQLRNAGCLEKPFALRVGFAPRSSHGATWLADLARGFKHIERTGELAAIQQRHGIVPARGVDGPAGARARE